MAPIKARVAVPATNVQDTEDGGKAPCPACVPARRAGDSTQALPEPSPPQDDDWALQFG